MNGFLLSLVAIAVVAGVLLGLVCLVFFLIRKSRDRKDSGSG